MARIETGRKSRAGAPLPEIPDKLYFRIGEVARLLAVPTYVLRFWETEFPHLKPGKGGTGQRLYRRRDLDALLEVRRLLYDQGFTIPGARQFLRDRTQTADAQSLEVPTLDVSTPERNAVKEQTTSPAAEDGQAPELAEAPESMDAIAVLLRLRAELHGLADLLSQSPVGSTGVKRPHHGLHLAGRKRAPASDLPTLFAVRQHTIDRDTKDQDTDEQERNKQDGADHQPR